MRRAAAWSCGGRRCAGGALALATAWCAWSAPTICFAHVSPCLALAMMSATAPFAARPAATFAVFAARGYALLDEGGRVHALVIGRHRFVRENSIGGRAASARAGTANAATSTASRKYLFSTAPLANFAACSA